MEDNTPTRKSGRARKPNQKYTNDILETQDLEVSDADDPIPLQRYEEDSRNDQDFHLDQTVEEPDLSAEEESSAAEQSEGSDNATPAKLPDYDVSDGEPLAYQERPKRRTKRNPLVENHSRGTGEKIDITNGSQRRFIESFIGTDEQDVDVHLKGIWKWGSNVSLPTTKCNNNVGGMSHPISHTSEQREMEATVGWDWYYLEGGKEYFADKQESEVLSVEEGTHYLPKPAEASHSVLMGPYGRQKLLPIPFMQTLNIDDAWSQARAMNASETGFTPVPKAPTKRQDGWILNVGASVQCLEWAPNHLGTQYLAVSMVPLSDPLYRGQKGKAPAYTPLPGPSSIQIWTMNEVDKELLQPQLRLVICNEWGHAKQLKWCPMPRQHRDSEDGEQTCLGLLAGVWADGIVRVLDVFFDRRDVLGTDYVKYVTPSFESRPADAMCTCVDWLSPIDLAVGCSNGYVAIWNIFPAQVQHRLDDLSSLTVDATNPDPTSTNFRHHRSTSENVGPTPYFYTFLHPTYILAICSAYPTHPHLIATSAASGYVRLTDIRSADSDYVLTQRTHWAPSTLCYSATLSCFVGYEEHGFVKLYPIRRFWMYLNCAKGDSEILSVAIGHLHPTVLVGFADGTLLAANLAKRFVEVRAARAMLQQRVWKHEWAQQKYDNYKHQTANGDNEHIQSSQQESDGAPDAPHLNDQVRESSEQMNGQQDSCGPKAISRITEGYKVQTSVLLSRTEVANENQKRTQPGMSQHVPYSTIYDKETGVRQVAWNPNEGWGGWAASGTGSGLVRIEDLAI